MIKQALKWLLVATGVSLVIVVVAWLLRVFIPPLIALAQSAKDPFASAVTWVVVGSIVGVLIIVSSGALWHFIDRIKPPEGGEALIAQAGSHVTNELFKKENGTLKNLVTIAGPELPVASIMYISPPEGLVKGKDPVWKTKPLKPKAFSLYHGRFKSYVLSITSRKGPAPTTGVGPLWHETSHFKEVTVDEHDR